MIKIPRLKELKEVPTNTTYTNDLFLPNELIRNIYAKGKVKNEEGEVIKISSAINPREGMYMYSLIKENKFKNCLEVGMANGMSSLYITQALAENAEKDLMENKESFSTKKSSYKLISIDPFQKTQWKNVGVYNLKLAGLDKYHQLSENFSYFSLPSLLMHVRDGSMEPFDFIFVDGMHLFDYTLVDLFYATLLLRKGGVLLLDDIRHKGVISAYNYIIKNYPHLRLVKNTLSSDTLATFVKVDEDTRRWDFHVNF